MTSVLENKPRVTFLVMGDILELWQSKTLKQNSCPTRNVLELW